MNLAGKQPENLYSTDSEESVYWIGRQAPSSIVPKCPVRHLEQCRPSRV